MKLSLVEGVHRGIVSGMGSFATISCKAETKLMFIDSKNQYDPNIKGDDFFKLLLDVFKVHGFAFLSSQEDLPEMSAQGRAPANEMAVSRPFLTYDLLTRDPQDLTHWTGVSLVAFDWLHEKLFREVG